MTPVLYWFRQDLRLADLPALAAALTAEKPVVPVYIYDPAMVPGAASRWWLHHSLAALDRALRQRGSRLVLRRGDWAEQIARLRLETAADQVFATTMPEPLARSAERKIKNLHLSGGHTLFNPDLIKSQTGSVYEVYSPFARACLARSSPALSIPAPQKIPAPPEWPASEQLSAREPAWAAGWQQLWQPGEAGAWRAFEAFRNHALSRYETDRDRPDRAGTSRLSPHLHYGEISPAALWNLTAAAEKFRMELLWREFALYLLWHRPLLPERSLRPEFEHFGWREDPAALAAWQQGNTGVPIVDAGMRELWQTGTMHNRIRMVVGSFLTKHLLLRWQQGAAWFLDTLVDADLAANATNWQWVAGSGVEAQPFFRIFNPVTQGEKFDPDGAYVRRYVPELRSIAGKAIHAPWLLGPLERRAIDYPPPLVDLAAGRARALAAFAALR